MKTFEEAKDHLLPCPFCNTQPEWINQALADSHYYIRCPHCQFTMRQDRRDKVIGFWNRREAAELYARSMAAQAWEDAIDRKESFKESIKAAIENVIFLQEQEQREEFNSGKEEAFNYAIEMIDKHFNDHYVLLADGDTFPIKS